jgi:hypothetical protein
MVMRKLQNIGINERRDRQHRADFRLRRAAERDEIHRRFQPKAARVGRPAGSLHLDCADSAAVYSGGSVQVAVAAVAEAARTVG